MILAIAALAVVESRLVRLSWIDLVIIIFYFALSRRSRSVASKNLQ